jgi:colanic acid/amylovoran biosynthesis glycosyltransferase
MRILFIVGIFPCVSQTFVMDQITGLLDRGHEIEIYALGESGSAIHPDVHKYDLLSKCWERYPKPSNKFVRRLKALLILGRLICVVPHILSRFWFWVSCGREISDTLYWLAPLLVDGRLNKFDLIHCHFGDNGVWVNRWRQLGVINTRISVVFHAYEMCLKTAEEYRAFYAPLFKSNAILLPISNYWYKLLAEWGAETSRMFVHHMGVNCKSIQFKPRVYSPGDEIKILVVGRLVESKGIEYGILAMAELLKSHPNVKYTVVGDGDLRKNLEILVFRLGLENVVIFEGVKSSDDVRHYLSESHIFLSPHITPSNGKKEGIPCAIMEAMASGAVVVTTRHSGIPELVVDDETGFLVEEKDVDGLAACLRRVLLDPSIFHRIGLKARARVEADFNLDVLNDQLVELMESYVTKPAIHGDSQN